MKVLFVSLVVIVIDQLTKLSVRFSFEYGRSQEVLGNFLRLTYIENPGMAFGIQFGGQAFFTFFAALAAVVIFVYIFRARRERLSLRFSLALILGGAIGNLIDRFLYGKVVDFIDIGIGTTRWPIFNLADTAVTIGMVILVTLVLFDRGFRKQENSEITAEREAYS